MRLFDSGAAKPKRLTWWETTAGNGAGEGNRTLVVSLEGAFWHFEIIEKFELTKLFSVLEVRPGSLKFGAIPISCSNLCQKFSSEAL